MQSEEKIAAVVILYHPDADVFSNIKSYYNYVDWVYVFDNTEMNSGVEGSLKQFPKVEFYHDGKNEGISKRLNAAATLSIERKFDWLLTMDQDTSFSKAAIEAYLKCFKNYPNKDQVGMFGTDYGLSENTVSPLCQPQEAENLITSGMLLNLNAFKKIGPFDEKLFIDSVDHDYCIRTKIAGFSIVKFTNIYIQHRLGEQVFRSSIKTLFLIRKKKIVHSPLRCYYMYRNMLYLENKFKKENFYLSNNLRKIVIGNLKSSFFYGRNTILIIKYLFSARRDFNNNQMGKKEF